MSEAGIRQVLILSRIPTAPKKISTQEIADYLDSYGIRVGTRTIQRDIAQLGAYFGIDRVDSNGYGREGSGWTRIHPLNPGFEKLLRNCRLDDDYTGFMSACGVDGRHTAPAAATTPSPARHLW